MHRPALCLDDAVALLADPESMDAIGWALCDYLRSTFGIGLILRVRDDLALGWKGYAPSCGVDRIESIMVPLKQTSAFSMASGRMTIFRGAPPTAGAAVHKQVWKLLKCEPPQEVVVLPVVVFVLKRSPNELGLLADGISAVTEKAKPTPAAWSSTSARSPTPATACGSTSS